MHEPVQEFKVLYLFSGPQRSTGIPERLHQLAQASKKPVRFQVDAFDILRDPSHDLLGDDLRQSILKKLEDGYYDVVIASPPCGTWSRAPWANVHGPRPLRSSMHPYGFPWLEGWRLRKVTQANSMVDLSLQALTICLKLDLLFLLEHPEDLGATPRYSPGMRPASIWRLLPIRSWVAANQAYSGAFFQCAFGASSPKPTRLLRNIVELNSKLWDGLPCLDANGHYLGPLPPRCRCLKPHQTLIRKTPPPQPSSNGFMACERHFLSPSKAGVQGGFGNASKFAIGTLFQPVFGMYGALFKPIFGMYDGTSVKFDLGIAFFIGLHLGTTHFRAGGGPGDGTQTSQAAPSSTR